MGWAQVTYLALVAIGWGYTVAKHGQARDPYSMWGQSIASAISLGLLWAGGFFAGHQVWP